MADTNLVLNLTANGADKVANALNSVANSAEKTGGTLDRMGGLGTAAMFAVGQAAYTMAARAVGAFTSVVEGGLSTAASVETNTMAIEAMTGSVAKAHQIMAQVMQEAKQSPFDTTALMDWTKKMLGAGMSADHVVTSIHTIGDAMAAFGLDTEHASSFMLAWTQMMSRGKIDLGDLNQMSNSGVSALQLFAKATGKSTGELSDMISKGKLLSKDVLPKVEQYMKSHYMGDQAKMAHTLTGEWDNLHDAMNIGLGQAIVPMEGALKNGLSKAIDLVNKATGWLATTGVPALMKFGGAVKTWLEDTWKKAQPAVNQALTFIRTQLIPDIGKIASFITHSVIPAVKKLWDNFGGLALGGLAIAWRAFQWGIDNLPKVGRVIKGVVDYLVSIKETLKTIGVGIGAAWIAMRAWAGLSGIWAVMRSVYAAWKLATAEQTTMQWLLNLAMDANPIGIIIGLIAAVTATTIYLWNTSAGFRNFMIEALKVLANVFLSWAGTVVNGAAWAFGWIPGLGDKLRTASGWFNQFSKDVNSDLNSLTDRTVTVTGQFQFANSPSFGKPTAGQAMVNSLFGKGGALHIGGSTGGGGGGSVGSYGGGGGGGNGYEGLSDAPPSSDGGGGGGGHRGSHAGAKARATARKNVMKDLEEGSSLWRNLLKGYDQLQTALKSLGDKVRDTGNKTAEAIVAASTRSLDALARTHDSLVTKLKASQDKLKDLKNSANDLIKSTRDNILSGGNIAEGEGKDFGSIKFKLQNEVAWSQQFGSVVEKLRKRGLGKVAIDQLIQAGPEQGMAYAQSILAQGKSGIDQINKLQGSLGRAGKSLGITAADSMYGAGLQAANGIVKGLEKQKGAIERTMEKIAHSMARALRKALGIHSPSRVFHELGEFTGQGLVNGINSTRDAASVAAAGLLHAGMGGQLAGVPAFSGAGRQPQIVVNVHGAIDPVSTARQIKKVLAQGDARGVNGAR